MKARALLSLIPMYGIILVLLVIAAFLGSQAVTVFTENAPVQGRRCVIIDAGHGSPDGGASSCSGVLESDLNLQIAQRLNDLMHLLGINTVMIRTDDTSVYTEGDSIAAKKVSDLKQRVKVVNEIDNALLISIHQNYFSDPRYSGAQVFYAKTDDSDTLASKLQLAFVNTLNPGSKRRAKPSDGIYLMNHINCTGILVECGFLSNPQEEAKLCSKQYQLDLCCVIACVTSSYISDTVA